MCVVVGRGVLVTGKSKAFKYAIVKSACGGRAEYAFWVSLC